MQKNKINIYTGNEAINLFGEQCEKIFDENNQGHIFNRSGIRDNKLFELVVATQIVNNSEIAVGYQLLYFDGDFVSKDSSCKEKLVFDNVLYFWDICTKKGFERQGIQTKLFNFAFVKYKSRDSYTISDKDNIPSVMLQEKLGFAPIFEFVESHNNQNHINCIYFRKHNDSIIDK